MILINNKLVEPIRFPAGELGVRLTNDHAAQLITRRKGHYRVDWLFEDSSEYFVLAQIIDSMKRVKAGVEKVHIDLYLPYFPYGRQDRAVNWGEANALQVFCTALNNLELDCITTLDPHSLAIEQHFAPGKLNVWSQLDCFKTDAPEVMREGVDVVIAPDAGAVKKAQAIADELGATLVVCFKNRNKLTGKVENLTVSNPTAVQEAKKILVADDICDGGATFIAVAQALDALTTAERYLFTTHGIYSKGKAVLREHYTDIACSYDFTKEKHNEN